MIEALWSVKFFGTDGRLRDDGAGVVVMESNRVLGGDGSFSYVGSYEVKNGDVSARIRVKRHANANPSVLGLEDYVLLLSGKVDANAFALSGFVEGDVTRRLTTHLTRIAELP